MMVSIQDTDSVENKKTSTGAPANELEASIIRAQSKLQSIINSNAGKPGDETRDLLQDMHKLQSLKRVEIPQKPPAQPLIYYSLAESAGGVTAKVSLISEEKLTQQLNAFNTWSENHPTNDLQAYNESRRNFKLSINAIIKLPKHGDILEVQREAIALSMSRVLGLETTHSNLMEHEGKPALFVPFQDIKLLNEVATGKNMQALVGSLKTYTHYSTVNPVGEGLQANTVINDFGNAFGFFYLCSDTDGVGAYNQNKALKGNDLFVFDQVFSLKDKLGLDSRLSMQPIAFLTKNLRHDQGRNRTIIEDSSIESKFASLQTLQQKKNNLLAVCDQFIAMRSAKVQDLTNQLEHASSAQRPDLLSKLQDEQSLLEDAKKIKIKTIERIDNISSVLPKMDDSLKNQPELQKSTLILEKWLNKPVSFASDGRPYRNPWTQRNTNQVQKIANDKNSDYVIIQFNKNISKDMLDMIKRQTGSDIQLTTNYWMRSNTALRVKKSDLLAFKENSLLPEREAIKSSAQYLNADDLNVIKQGYPANRDNEKIIAVIKAFNEKQNKTSQTMTSTLASFSETEQQLREIIAKSADKGFGKHVLTKFQFDVQQRLQNMAPAGMREKINDAFNAAIKLDQISTFNTVVAKHAHDNTLSSDKFSIFLNTCNAMSEQAINHGAALENSRALTQTLSGPIATPIEETIDTAKTTDYAQAEVTVLTPLPIAQDANRLTAEQAARTEASAVASEVVIIPTKDYHSTPLAKLSDSTTPHHTPSASDIKQQLQQSKKNTLEQSPVLSAIDEHTPSKLTLVE